SEELEYNRISDQYVTPLIDLTNRVVSPQVAANTQQAVQSLLSGDPFRLLRQHRLFARLLVPAVSALSIKFARTQTAVDLATTACAIERYQLANGRYPENLQQLVPTFIAKVPKDVIDGNPLRYRTEKDRFVLYSIGWNATDDSGAYPLKPEREISELRGSGNDRPESGDWAWRYPAAD
ncbi:MAG TPA: hypothetical protein VL793_13105, partial [Patescibacteria group bacterium]|nr:hypothetical protein [Patescibacteria group bacterium]